MRAIHPSSEDLKVPITRGEFALFKELLEDPDSPLKIVIRLEDNVLMPAQVCLHTTYVRKKNPATGKFEKYPAHVELALKEVRIADEVVLFDVDKVRPIEDYLCLASKFNVRSDFFDVILSIHAETANLQFMAYKSFFCVHNLGLHDKHFVTMELAYFMDLDPDLYHDWKIYAANLARQYIHA